MNKRPQQCPPVTPFLVVAVGFLLCHHIIEPSLAFIAPASKGRSWFHMFKINPSSSGLGNNGKLPPPPPPRNPNVVGRRKDDDDDDDDHDWNDEFVHAAPSLLIAMMQDEQRGEQDKDMLNGQSKNDGHLTFDENDHVVVDEKEGDKEKGGKVAKHSSHPESSNSTSCLRGGSTGMKTTGSNPTKDIVAGTKSSIQTTIAYWSDAFQHLQERILNLLPIHRNKKSGHDIDLTKIPIQDVLAPTSDILPDIVVKRAAQRSGMLGSVMTADRVNDCARQLKQWYVQRGYVLHSVTGATLHAENGTATLAVQEPILSSIPMDIRFAKEVPIDPETGETTTRRKYREKLERIKGRPLRNEEWIAVADRLNTTLIESKGRTSANTLSKRLGLKAGNHFCWDGDRWQSIARSGIFSKIWRASPVQMGDGTVQLQVLCQESPPRNLEYGISKSLYTGNWVSCIKNMK
jgi:hypothetical protein